MSDNDCYSLSVKRAGNSTPDVAKLMYIGQVLLVFGQSFLTLYEKNLLANGFGIAEKIGFYLVS